MDIRQINSAIIHGKWSNEDLTSMIDAVKWARSKLGKQVKHSLMLGDNVQFTSSKTGRTMLGTVQKIAIKYVTVRTIDGLWKVPANMLSLVEEEFA